MKLFRVTNGAAENKVGQPVIVGKLFLKRMPDHFVAERKRIIAPHVNDGLAAELTEEMVENKTTRLRENHA